MLLPITMKLIIFQKYEKVRLKKGQSPPNICRRVAQIAMSVYIFDAECYNGDN